MDDKSRHLKTYQGVFARLNRSVRLSLSSLPDFSSVWWVTRMLANNTNKRVSLRIIQAGELLLRSTGAIGVLERAYVPTHVV
jgi:hypothetical protein